MTFSCLSAATSAGMVPRIAVRTGFEHSSMRLPHFPRLATSDYKGLQPVLNARGLIPLQPAASSAFKLCHQAR